MNTILWYYSYNDWNAALGFIWGITVWMYCISHILLINTEPESSSCWLTFVQHSSTWISSVSFHTYNDLWTSYIWTGTIPYCANLMRRESCLVARGDWVLAKMMNYEFHIDIQSCLLVFMSIFRILHEWLRATLRQPQCITNVVIAVVQSHWHNVHPKNSITWWSHNM